MGPGSKLLLGGCLQVCSFAWTKFAVGRSRLPVRSRRLNYSIRESREFAGALSLLNESGAVYTALLVREADSVESSCVCPDNLRALWSGGNALIECMLTGAQEGLLGPRNYLCGSSDYGNENINFAVHGFGVEALVVQLEVGSITKFVEPFRQPGSPYVVDSVRQV